MQGWFTGVLGKECSTPGGGQFEAQVDNVVQDDDGSPETPWFNAPVDDTISPDVKFALKRTNAMCKTMFQAVQASCDNKIAEMDKKLRFIGNNMSSNLSETRAMLSEIKAMAEQNQTHILHNKKGIRDNQERIAQNSVSIAEGAAAEPLAPSAATARLQLGSHCLDRPTLQLPQGSLSLIKDDVQTIIDNMRLELLKQKAVIKSLDERVQQLVPGKKAEGSALQQMHGDKFDWDGTGDDSTSGSLSASLQNYITLQRFDEMYAEFKRDIHNIRVAVGVVDADVSGADESRTLPVSKQEFEQFSEAVGKELKHLHQDITGFKDQQELTAVKAGFLAVAATECNHEEKDQLFQTLKAQEEEYFRKTNYKNHLRDSGQ